MADETYYKIAGSLLTRIADRTRLMGGSNRRLNAVEIADMLDDVLFIPQGRANSGFSLAGMSFGSTAVGILPTVYSGMANSELSLAGMNFSSNAVGELVESEV